MIERNTKQKEIILDILEHNRIHPTIYEIYELAKKKYPAIGQATIYRNVNKLVDENKIIKLPSKSNDGYHYDINTNSHDHLLCKSCGKIIDIFDNDYTKNVCVANYLLDGEELTTKETKYYYNDKEYCDLKILKY